MHFWFQRFNWAPAAIILILFAGRQAVSQSTLATGENDPVKLFQLAQDEHEHGNLKAALELYDAAIKLRSEFPEAQFQKGVALQQLKRYSEAELAFRKALELRPEWAQPYANLGAVLFILDKQDEGAKALTQCLTLEPGNSIAIRTWTTIPIPSKLSHETLAAAREQVFALAKLVGGDSQAGSKERATRWLALAMIDQASNSMDAAASDFDQAVALDGSAIAFSLRSEFRNRIKNIQGSVTDAESAYRISSHSIESALLLARQYVNAGRFDDALTLLNSLPDVPRRSAAAMSIKEAIVAGSAEGPEGRKALEALVQKDPHNAALLARLGASYRVDDPQRSLEFYKRAVESEPRNPNYATGYGAALVQAKRFADATALLRQVVAADPGNYAAHANLATALYELKSYEGAISEYNWLKAAKPDLIVADFFIAISFDNLGQYDDALRSYEEFLAKADPSKNELEIEKVNLRLPALKNQIKRGAGAKPQKKK